MAACTEQFHGNTDNDITEIQPGVERNKLNNRKGKEHHKRECQREEKKKERLSLCLDL